MKRFVAAVESVEKIIVRTDVDSGDLREAVGTNCTGRPELLLSNHPAWRDDSRETLDRP